MRHSGYCSAGRCGACDFVQVDVVRVGGITPSLEIAALARAWGARRSLPSS